MRLRHALLGVVLCALALSLFACVEPEPLPPPPPPPVVTPPPAPWPERPLYFVNVSGLALREGPSASAPQIATLGFNTEVELLDTSAGWARVRELDRGLVGWAAMRYLQPAPASRPRPVPSRRPPATKERAPKAPETPKEQAPPPGETPAPKAM